MRHISENFDELEPFEVNSKHVDEISEKERNMVISILKEEFKLKHVLNSSPKDN